MTNSNLMVVLSSPSGAGKTTLTKKIQQKFQNFKISVSHTTRKARPNEVDGIDYFFVDKNLENNLINADIHDQIIGSDHCPISIDIRL